MRYYEIIRLDERIEDITKTLSKYKDREDVFISFRSIPKLGINPQSQYDTPIGIYAYPLKEMWEDLIKNNIPFAGDQPYVVAFTVTGFVPDVSPVCSTNPYTETMLQRDIETIKARFLKSFSEYYDDSNNIDHTYGNQRKYAKSIKEILKTNSSPTANYISNYSEDTLSKGPDWWHSEKEKLVSDEALSPEQFNTIYNLIKRFHKGEPFDGRKAIDPEEVKTHFEFFINHWLESANLDTPCSQMWNVTRNLAELLTKHKITHSNYVGQKAAIMWTGILRALGYEGFTDRTGSGQIHGNEPCQAVFFSLKNIKLIEILHNARKTEQTIDYLGDLSGMLSDSYGLTTYAININKILPEILMNFGQLVSTGKTKYLSINDKDKFESALRGELPYFIEHLADKVLRENGKFSMFGGFAKWYLSSDAELDRSEKSDNQFVQLINRATYYFENTKLYQSIIKNPVYQKISSETQLKYED